MKGFLRKKTRNEPGREARTGSGTKPDGGRAEHRVFLEQFSGLSRNTIRPVMEHVMELIRKMGFDSGISERKEMTLPDGSFRNAEIRLTIVPPGCEADAADPEHCPAVVFSVPFSENVIRVQVSRKLPGGGWRPETVGELRPAAVTEEEVSGHILKVLELAAEKA
ncbi:MAG: hypothetical protein QUS35_08270 [bacterium]|nr:hypothetical protein [bacterium]